MNKVKTIFYCGNCGSQSPKWIGKCPSCNEWNTYAEEIIKKDKSENGWESAGEKPNHNFPQTIGEIRSAGEERIKLPDNEMNRVLGGGLVKGSVVLLGGEPGIGKSTLMLQIALYLKGTKVLYVSGEESSQQIKMRAERTGNNNPECYILMETSIQQLFQHVKKIKPAILIVDSIQTLHTSYIDSSPGSISQIRECASDLQRYAKETSTPVFLIGHITKEGMLAGPKVLEHMVDVVLQFEGENNHIYRIIRAVKNRFGSTAELGIYEMQGEGLREVSNPSEILISRHDEPLSGSAVSATIEGARAMLIEIQSLVSSAAYGTPQRSSTGFDTKRLNMLLAVLEKKCGFRLGAKDVFLNIAGGIRVIDPAIDLGAISAVLSSNEDIPISPNICFSAEVSLSGEIRPVSRIDHRIAEAEKLGFEKIFISGYNKKSQTSVKRNIEIVPVKKVENIMSLLFG